MIVGLRGIVVYKDATLVHLDVGGVIYGVHVTPTTSSQLPLNREAFLHVVHLHREDMEALYGFLDPGERELFQHLIGVAGIGPKVAMAICSTYDPAQFLQILQRQDLKALTKVPGVGPKSGKRILMELGELELDHHHEEDHYKKARLALEHLGFHPHEVQEVLKECRGEDTPSLVKEALRRLQRI
ncbi:MAG: Holliday junction branch migration protein RuvA [Nitratiruptor sp.]|nr:Holliday junction branch migration protein RuvA [Nitratiruptor sp.]NPA83218.1 Holliday junction branch migration protein RuvA [Campylobacterota bacterium]